MRQRQGKKVRGRAHLDGYPWIESQQRLPHLFPQHHCVPQPLGTERDDLEQVGIAGNLPAVHGDLQPTPPSPLKSRSSRAE